MHDPNINKKTNYSKYAINLIPAFAICGLLSGHPFIIQGAIMSLSFYMKKKISKIGISKRFNDQTDLRVKSISVILFDIITDIFC